MVKTPSPLGPGLGPQFFLSQFLGLFKVFLGLWGPSLAGSQVGHDDEGLGQERILLH